jgi:2-polyprenyl-6-methoxyphenol hydroxylase-like FAD-dependent oxidoreductase
MNKHTRPTTMFEADYHQWSVEQAVLLRAGKMEALDRINLAQEIENLGRSEKREIESRLEILLVHLLKWQFQPDRRSKSWRMTLKVQRNDLQSVLNDNPSLKRHPSMRMKDVYLKARLAAEKETGPSFEDFPEQCPYSMVQIMDETFPA